MKGIQLGEKVGEKLGEKVGEKTGEKVGESLGESHKLNLCLFAFFHMSAEPSHAALKTTKKGSNKQSSAIQG